MARDGDVTLNHAAMREVLKSADVRAQVRKIAETMAGTARGRTQLDIEVTTAIGRNRAGARVWMLGANAAREESLHRILGRSLPNGS